MNVQFFRVFVLLFAATISFPSEARAAQYSFFKNGVKITVTGSQDHWALNPIEIDISMNGRSSEHFILGTIENNSAVRKGYKFLPAGNRSQGLPGITVLDKTPRRQVVRILYDSCVENDADHYTSCSVDEFHAIYLYAAGFGTVSKALELTYDDAPIFYNGKNGFAGRVVKTQVLPGENPAFLTWFVTPPCPGVSIETRDLLVLDPLSGHANGYTKQKPPVPGQLIGIYDQHGEFVTEGNITTLAAPNSKLWSPSCGHD